MSSSSLASASFDAQLACRFLSFSVVIVSAVSVVLRGPLPPPPGPVAQIGPARPEVGPAPPQQVAQVVNIPQHVTEPQAAQARQQATPARSQHKKPAGQKANLSAQTQRQTQKLLAKKLGDKGQLTLETYTRCVARELDVDEPLAVSVLIQESDARNPMQRGKRGSRGPLQIQPIALEEVGLSRHERSLPLLVYGGLRYLKTMMARFDNLQTALAAYNMGPTSLVRRDYLPYRITRRYVRQVLNRAGKIRSGDVPSYPVLQYLVSQRDLSSRHHKIAPLQACLVS